MAWINTVDAAAASSALMVDVNEALLRAMHEKGMTASGLSTFLYGHPGTTKSMPAPDRAHNFTLESLARIAAALGQRVEIKLVPR